MTWRKQPLNEVEGKIASSVTAGVGFNELSTALKLGLMPHQWLDAPRWSRILAMAINNINAKISYLDAQD